MINMSQLHLSLFLQGGIRFGDLSWNKNERCCMKIGDVSQQCIWIFVKMCSVEKFRANVEKTS